MTTTPVGTAKPTLSAQVAREIRAEMGRQRMSAAKLARQLGVSEAWTSRRLSGDQTIDLNDLQRIADVLGVDPLALWPQEATRINARSHVMAEQAMSDATRATDERRRAPDRPKGRPVNEATRPASGDQSSRRRPSRIRPAGRTMPR